MSFKLDAGLSSALSCSPKQHCTMGVGHTSKAPVPHMPEHHRILCKIVFIAMSSAIAHFAISDNFMSDSLALWHARDWCFPSGSRSHGALVLQATADAICLADLPHVQAGCHINISRAQPADRLHQPGWACQLSVLPRSQPPIQHDSLKRIHIVGMLFKCASCWYELLV